ncbi:MAG: prolyl-tRNA synthetase [Solirubrobacteraceae bacterium]|jgi:prolyl-tRNA synthetase|nr:prolyl-tRNA synthetase [Solirubrobacteraceae bacterium]
MTRLTEYLLPTEKQAPADAEAVSHKLVVRAGLARQLGAGLWTWMPAGWRVHETIVQIVREEINRAGGQELLMPVLNPAELWKRSGRYYIDELFKLQDRRGAEMVLAITHEEVVTFHVSSLVRSYRDLPFSLYHFQTKERDEPRPRAGVLRTREFIMKDAYTFDRDRAGLDAHYERYREAYDRIFDRVGLEWYRVESDVGAMGGLGAHEYMAPSAAGENDVALAPGYAANVEVASADPQPVRLPPGLPAPEAVHTPGLTTVAQVAAALEVPEGALLKAYPVVTAQRGLVLVVVRGDHRVNDIKLANALGESVRPAQESEFAQRIGPAGYIGPVGADAPILLDEAVAPGAYVSGANRPDEHLRGVEPGRDFTFERADVRTVEAGDTVGGHPIRIEPAIEVGNIFKLGTRYSEPLRATYLDESGAEQPIWMGSYGIGPARIAAAAIEQHADDHGISWPKAIAPWDIHLVGLGRDGSEERALAERLYDELLETGLEILYDDRDLGPGQKFADAELLGVPLRLTVGRRTASSGEVEAQIRRGREDRAVALEGAAQGAMDLWRSLA